MKIRFFVFLFVFGLVGSPAFSATPNQGSGSGSLGKPALVFKSWRVGRSPTGTVRNTEQLSFITTSETECWLQASVMYKGGNQPKNTAPIDPDTVKWEFPTSELNKGWKVEPPGTSWSGSHPSKLSGTTSFNVLVKFTLPEYDDKTYYTIAHSCGGNAARRSRSPKHRSGEPMKITVKFSAKTTQGDLIVVDPLKLKQDEVDQIRQEHVDYDRVIPARGAFKDSDGDYNNFGRVYYDFGHYDKMIDKGMKGYQEKWIKSINDRERKGKTALSMSDFTLNSAYRNPHHNFEHAGSKRWRISPHMYGYALDIQGRDVDGKKGADQQKMDDAADAAGARFTDIYDTGHVHADWAPSSWGSSKTNPAAPKFSLLKQSTDKPLVVEKKVEQKKLARLSGSGSATAGSTYTVSVTTPKPFSSVVWYIKPPNHPGFGSFIGWTKASGGSTSGSFSYKFASDASAGDYVFKGFIYDYSDSSSMVELHHTVSVSAKPKVPPVSKQTKTQQPQQTQQNQQNQQDQNQQPQPDPPRPTQDRQPQERTKQPKPDNLDTQTPKSDRQRPTATCSAGHTYYSDGRSSVERHKDRRCTRCSLTYQNCTNHSSACQNSKWHTEDPSAAPKPKPTTKTTNTNVPTAPTTPTPSVSYHACGLHRSSVSGDHSLQASCSQTNSRGDRCTATSFYACLHLLHTYPKTSSDTPRRPRSSQETKRPCGHPTTAIGSHSWVSKCSYYNSDGKRCTKTSGYYRCTPHTHEYPSPKKPKSACPADSWTKCGGSTSHAATCSAGHSYYTCASLAWHKDRTCTRCSKTYQDCKNSASACQGSHWHTQKAISKPKPKPTTVKCARQACGETVSDRLAHKVSVCPSGCGNHYWTCIDGATDRHTKTYTCRRDGCGKTFTKCTNTPTACVRAGKPSNYHWAK